MVSFASMHVPAAILPLSVISLHPQQELFRSVQAGKYVIIKTSTDLTAAVLESSSASAGKGRSSLSLTDKMHNEKWSSACMQYSQLLDDKLRIHFA